MDYSQKTVLGKHTECPEQYAPSVLTPISRCTGRGKLGIDNELPFRGADIWNAWELSWLNPKGKPKVAIGTIEIPCDSVNIIESKSFKLYLNSLNQTAFTSEAEVVALIRRDLSAVAEGDVKVRICPAGTWQTEPSPWADAICLDALDLACSVYTPDPGLLCSDNNAAEVSEKLCSHLLKSNCPVTGQPDWATLYIQYTGKPIDHSGLLRYIVSMRGHQDFHEHCTESIFIALMQRCQPRQLAVYARYTRRGGLDINPFRANFNLAPGNTKLPRQ